VVGTRTSTDPPPFPVTRSFTGRGISDHWYEPVLPHSRITGAGRGGRDGAGEDSGAGDLEGIRPPTGDQASLTGQARGAPGGGSGDGRLVPFSFLPCEGGAGGREFPSIPPQGLGGTDGSELPSISYQGTMGVDGRVFPSSLPQRGEGEAGGVYLSIPPRPLGERDQAAPPLPCGPYDGRARQARATGPTRTPRHESEDRAPQGPQDAAVLSAALRNSLDASISP